MSVHAVLTLCVTINAVDGCNQATSLSASGAGQQPQQGSSSLLLDAPSHTVASSSADLETTAPTARGPRRRTHECDPSEPNSDGTPKRAKLQLEDQPGETIVMRYDDFGPPVSAWELLGFEWWTWEPGGSFAWCDDFDVRVVVYRRVTRGLAEARYPGAKSKDDLVQRGLPDIRYLEYADAIVYLDRAIAGNAGEPELQGMYATLRATRNHITEQLGP